MSVRTEPRPAGADGAAAPAVVHVVLPGDIDDPAAPSGGNRYDRQICAHLPDAGWAVRERPVPGAWPRPDADATDRLADALAAVPDGALVLLDGLVGCAAPQVLARHAARLRTVLLVHLPLADETGIDPADAAGRHAREHRSVHVAAAVVATSEAARRRLIDRHGLPADRVHVVAPGVAAAPLAPGTDGASRLLCVAGLTHRKGQDLLVEALARTADRPWRCDLVGAADGPHARQVAAAISAYDLAGRIRILGARAGAELDACYREADLVVLPSRAETYGMVVTEALARGIPVLATSVAGVGEALGRAADGSLPGLLVPPEDPAALAAALRRWYDEPALRDRLRTAARARRTHLTGWDTTARSLATVLRRVADGPGGIR